MKKNLNSRLFGYINAFGISSFLILLFNSELNDIEYSLWGILTSITLVFSIITQFIMPNMIEKDFVNLDKNTKSKLLKIYFYCLVILSPFIYGIITFVYNNNSFVYSQKFIIPLLILFLVIVENSINIINKLLIASKNNQKFDLVELFLIKYLRLLIFLIYFITTENVLFFHVVLIHVLTRTFSLTLLIYINKNAFKNFKIFKREKIDLKFFKNFINSNLNNFYLNLSQILFYNFLFLYSSNQFNEKIYSNLALYFVIFIFCRNFFDAFANLETPNITKNIKNINLKKFEKKYLNYSVFIVSVALLSLDIFFKFDFHNFFGSLITRDSSKYIIYGILHGFITGIYSFRHYIIKFDQNKYKNHLIFYLINSLLCFAIYIFTIKITNIIQIFFISLFIFESVNIIYYYISTRKIDEYSSFYSFNLNFIFLIISLILNNFFFYIFLVVISSRKIFKN